MAISPDVVSFVRDRLGDCDLRCGGGIRDVAREVSSISLETGISSPATSVLMRSQLPISSLLSSWVECNEKEMTP